MRIGRRLELTGQRFGHLVVTKFSRIADGYSIWWVTCVCGNIREYAGKLLTSGEAKSCGCRPSRYRDIRVLFGSNLKREYNSWHMMQVRCKKVESYIEKGIVVCARWTEPDNGFMNFLEDMGPRPEGTSLDRIEADLHYDPSNCRWATPEIQVANRECMNEDVEVFKDKDHPALCY